MNNPHHRRFVVTLRDQATERIMSLLDGTNKEDDDVRQIVDDVLIFAFEKGMEQNSTMVVIDNLTELTEAVRTKVLEEYSG